MERLVVNRHGRRIFGWAYRPGGAGAALWVDLLHRGEVVDHCLADLTLLQGNRFLSHSEHRRHGFEFLLPTALLQAAPSDLQLQLRDHDLRRDIPAPRAGFGRQVELHVDGVDGRGFGGWCWDPQQPDRSPQLSLLVPGSKEPKFQLQLTANRLRPDLVSSGMARGNCGFWLRWPVSLSLADREHSVLQYGGTRVRLGEKLRRRPQRNALDVPENIISF